MLETPASQSQSRAKQASAELLGHVHGISGSQATVGLLGVALNGPHRSLITVGKFLKIQTGRALLVGVITDVSIELAQPREQDYCAVAHVDLIGELERRGVGGMRFRRGVSGLSDHRRHRRAANNSELRIIFGRLGRGDDQYRTIFSRTARSSACVEIDEMLTKHFAVLGSTGVGKSSAVAHILLQMMQARPELRIFLLEPQRIRSLLRRSRACRQSRQSSVAFLAVQFRGDRGRLFRRPTRFTRRDRNSLRSHSARQG